MKKTIVDATGEQGMESVPTGFYGYFVSYSVGNGFGCMGIARNRPVKSIVDVESMIGLIEETLQTRYGIGNLKVVILNWRRFEDEPSDGAKEHLPVDELRNVVLRLAA